MQLNVCHPTAISHLLQNLYAKARVLELLEHELDAAFEKLQYKHVAPEPATVRRLHAANLPVGEAQMAMDLLGKFAAVQHNRKETEKERDQLLKSLDTAEGARRQAEFAKAKAEALATARSVHLLNLSTIQQYICLSQYNIDGMVLDTMQGRSFDAGSSQRKGGRTAPSPAE